MAIKNPNIKKRGATGPYPVGSPSGDHRMDQVEAQRGGVYGQRSIFLPPIIPGMPSAEGGAPNPSWGQDRPANPNAAPQGYGYPQPGPSPEGLLYEPQPTGSPATAAGHNPGLQFAALLALLKAMGGSQVVGPQRSTVESQGSFAALADAQSADPAAQPWYAGRGFGPWSIINGQAIRPGGAAGRVLRQGVLE